MPDTSPEIGNEMTGEESRSLLRSANHGVLSLGAGDRGYGLPMSFDYDEAADRLILGFANAPGCKKAKFAAETEEATMTVYRHHDVDSWESVIATGTLHLLEEEDAFDRSGLVFFARATAREDGSRWMDLDDLGRQWYELRIDHLTGRKSGRRSDRA